MSGKEHNKFCPQSIFAMEHTKNTHKFRLHFNDCNILHDFSYFHIVTVIFTRKKLAWKCENYLNACQRLLPQHQWIHGLKKVPHILLLYNRGKKTTTTNYQIRILRTSTSEFDYDLIAFTTRKRKYSMIFIFPERIAI